MLRRRRISRATWNLNLTSLNARSAIGTFLCRTSPSEASTALDRAETGLQSGRNLFGAERQNDLLVAVLHEGSTVGHS